MHCLSRLLYVRDRRAVYARVPHNHPVEFADTDSNGEVADSDADEVADEDDTDPDKVAGDYFVDTFKQKWHFRERVRSQTDLAPLCTRLGYSTFANWTSHDRNRMAFPWVPRAQLHAVAFLGVFLDAAGPKHSAALPA